MHEKRVDAIVVGAGLTGLTTAFYLKKAGKKVLVLEKNDRVGGVIQTHEENEFLFETGPNTGIIGSPELVQLFDDLSHRIKPEIANPEAKNRWVWKAGKWRPLPSGFFPAVSTPLFSLKDKFRILGEPWRKPGTNPNETVAELVKRRMGKSFLNYAVDPFISGIYAGDPNRLVTRYALPKLYNLEQNYGSFVKGAIKKKKEPKTELENRVSREVFSVKGGLKELIHALYAEIGPESFATQVSEVKINKEQEAYHTSWKNTEGNNVEFESETVITTVDGEALKNMLPFVNHAELKPITDLIYAKVVQAIAGFKEWKGDKLNAFGGLVPSIEKRNSLGILFPSAIFPERAPEKGALLSIFMGGMRRPDMIEKSDDEIKKLAIDEIQETLNWSGKPDMLKIFRYQKAIPQYEISSGERFKAIEKIERENPGLILAGNIRDGIGMADRVKQGKQVADQLNQK